MLEGKSPGGVPAKGYLVFRGGTFRMGPTNLPAEHANPALRNVALTLKERAKPFRTDAICQRFLMRCRECSRRTSFTLAMPPDGRAWSKLGADFHADDFARYDDFNATILLPACGGTVVNGRVGLAKPP